MKIRDYFLRIWRPSAALACSPFYETYPYRGRCDMKSADRRGAIDLDLSLFYNRIPKAANTTVVMNLARTKKTDGQSSRAIKKKFTRPSELSREEVSRFGSFFRFTIVRDPYSRVLSAYLDKVATGRKLISSRPRETPPTFREFCRYLDEGGWPENAHWAPQTDLLLLPPGKFDFIGRVESLESSLVEIFRQAGINQFTPDNFSKHASHATDAGDKIEEHYDEYCRSVVRRVYAEDFDTFGYKP